MEWRRNEWKWMEEMEGIAITSTAIYVRRSAFIKMCTIPCSSHAQKDELSDDGAVQRYRG